MTLAQDISQELDNAIASTSGEVPILKQFISNLKNMKTSPAIDIQAKFCHQKPYVFFVKPTRYANRIKCELGDILWVYKILSRGAVTDHRATFSQAKYSPSSPKFHIEEHQYKFLKDIDKNSFKFGNIVYSNAGYQPKEFTAIAAPNDFSNYLFINQSFSSRCECTNNLILSNPRSIDTVNMQSFEQYLYNFFCPKSFGMNILPNSDVRKLVDIVFKRLGLVLDPPEEWEGYFENDSSGFGVIFITINE